MNNNPPRLLGRPPGTFSNASGSFPCTPAPRHAAAASASAAAAAAAAAQAEENGGEGEGGTPPHCGWAWGSPYYGVEAESGIDTLGFLGADAMLQEVTVTPT